MPLDFKPKDYTDEEIKQAVLSIAKAIQPLFKETDTLFFVKKALEATKGFLEEYAFFKSPPLIEK
jgi:hypothetical protein